MKSINKVIAIGMVASLLPFSSAFANEVDTDLVAANPNMEFYSVRDVSVDFDSAERSQQFVMSSTLNASRPASGGVLSATAITSTNMIAHRVQAQAAVNHGSGAIRGTNRVNSDTSFAQSTRTGTSRNGVAESSHSARRTRTSTELSRSLISSQFR